MVEVLATASGKKRTHDPTEDLLLGMPGMMPMVKRPAFTDVKSGMPVYTAGTGTNAYQHLVTLQPSGYTTPVALAGHPPGMPRF
ncbi:hypothetical protein LSAT2_008867 [Lamellibrachia satsuma]|nr:hypothetical protein LSAT2_008867 [Lamellibrachia satsuma]